ncbi:hypothetical protein Thiosp_04435 [Thiorhodovibrio litoralis]|nr:hypothetical protein Thiosp_04435 [Thiorhodovibrio litoralis]
MRYLAHPEQHNMLFVFLLFHCPYQFHFYTNYI